MKFYKMPLEDGEVSIGGPSVTCTLTSGTMVYICTDQDGQDDWEEITQAEYEAAGGIVPVIEPEQPSLTEIRENQLILMDAIATVFETVIGGE